MLIGSISKWSLSELNMELILWVSAAPFVVALGSFFSKSVQVRPNLPNTQGAAGGAGAADGGVVIVYYRFTPTCPQELLKSSKSFVTKNFLKPT